MIYTRTYWGYRKGIPAELQRTAAGILSAYSGILFVDHPVVGFLFLGATFWYPNVGVAGLIGAAVGMAVGYGLRLPHATSGVNVYSSLLVGLSLGAYYALDFNLVVLITIAAALTVLFAAALRDLLWRLGRLPVLSLPFVVVAMTTALAAGAYGGLTPYYPPSQLPPAVFSSVIDGFLSSLGSVFFSPHPVVGAVLFAGILLRSRYLAFLCAVGYASGALVFSILATDPVPGLLAWTGFNFSLTAMALGGIFTVPSLSTFGLAVVGASVSAVVTGAFSQLLLVYSLPVMALPFLLTTLTFLAALRLRVTASPPTLLLEYPGLPEVNFERARLAEVRLGRLESVPLLPPFLGEWQVYQGFDGEHTHKDQWRYALDFHRQEDGRSFSGEGAGLGDYYCFGLPVLSPAYGIVAAIKDSLPDNAPGELDLRNNWGNHVLIQTDSGVFVLLAHLKQFSAKVREGERVTPSTPVASCGNSGRSPQPHLHLQVQPHRGLGGETLPFHLVSSIMCSEDDSPKFQLVANPREDCLVQRAEEDRALAGALHLPVGRTLRYQFASPDGSTAERAMEVKASLLGQLRLVADSGASVAFEQSNGTLGFFDRLGPSDPVLDLWTLAMGLTPLSALAMSWEDAPPARLLPLRLSERLALMVARPLGAGVESRFEREWSERDNAWIQRGTHELAVPGIPHRVSTTAALHPEHGCTDVEIEDDGVVCHLKLLAVGQIADRGVPAWEQAIPSVLPLATSNKE